MSASSPTLFNLDFQWRASFVCGTLLGSAIVYSYMKDVAYGTRSSVLLPGTATSYAIAGAMVGFGTRLGFGCTSGHMLCGLSRLSVRSLVATMVFFLTASVTTVLTQRAKDISKQNAIVPIALNDILFDLLLLGSFLVVFLGIPRLVNDRPRGFGISTNAAYQWSAFLAGIVFVVGLALGGMLQPAVIIQFLDGVGRLLLYPVRHVTAFQGVIGLPSMFDLSLAGVVLGGLLPNILLYPAIIRKREGGPFFDGFFCLPARTQVEWRLIAGPLLFGMGWGWAGICPGPALGNLITGETNGLVFMSACLASMYVFGRLAS